MKMRGKGKFSGVVTLRIEPELREVFEKWADEEDRSVGSLIRIILREAAAAREAKRPKKKSS
jgi:hypothetical protein